MLEIGYFCVKNKPAFSFFKDCRFMAVLLFSNYLCTRFKASRLFSALSCSTNFGKYQSLQLEEVASHPMIW